MNDFGSLMKDITGVDREFSFNKLGADVFGMYCELSKSDKDLLKSFFKKKDFKELLYVVPKLGSSSSTYALPVNLQKQMWYFLLTQLDSEAIDRVMSYRNQKHGFLIMKAQPGEVPEIYPTDYSLHQDFPVEDVSHRYHTSKSWLVGLAPTSGSICYTSDEGIFFKYPEKFLSEGVFYSVGSTLGESVERVQSYFKEVLKHPEARKDFPIDIHKVSFEDDYMTESQSFILDVLDVLPDTLYERAASLLSHG